MYKVVYGFLDLQDEQHYYAVGDTFPREGMEVSEERLTELMTDANKIGVPLIQSVPETPAKSSKSGEKRTKDKPLGETKNKPKRAKKEK